MTSNRTALPGSQLASSTSGKVVTGSASCWLVDKIRQLRGGQGGCLPPQRSFGHILPLQGSSQHPAQHQPCPGVTVSTGSLCASPVWTQTPRVVWRWRGWLGHGTWGQWLQLCHTQSAAPGVPCACWPWRRDPGHLCFPLTRAHGAQEVHKGWMSHFQPGPWLSGGTQGPSSLLSCCQQGGSRSTLPGTGRRCLSLSTSSKPQVCCGTLLFSTHPGLQLSARAGSFPGSLGLPESHARACRDQILSGAGAEGQGFSPVLPSAEPCSMDKPAWGGWLRAL